MAEILDRLAAALADRYRSERELGQGYWASSTLCQSGPVLRPAIAGTGVPAKATGSSLPLLSNHTLSGREDQRLQLAMRAEPDGPCARHQYQEIAFAAGTATGRRAFVSPSGCDAGAIQASADRESSVSYLEDACLLSICQATSVAWAHLRIATDRSHPTEGVWS